MASLIRKAQRVNLVAMDFVLQVTVDELVLNTLDMGRTLSFELSRGTKVRCRQGHYTRLYRRKMAKLLRVPMRGVAR